MLVALDSTDSVEGGCTTHALMEILRRLDGFDLAGPPRLVRLNPNVPYKTRGNGAVAVELGHGVGRRRVVGMAGDQEIVAYEGVDEPADKDHDTVFQTAKEAVDSLRAPGSNSGLAVLSAAPPRSFYERTVKTHVAPHDLPAISGSARTHGWQNARGLIGAFAAAAWPAQEGTFEVIAYRARDRWGSTRSLDASLGPELDAGHPSTFDNWDPVHGHLRIAPRSPCPILAGIRGTQPAELVAAKDLVGPEPFESWLLFATNQATGDHLTPTGGAGLRPYDSPQLVANAVDRPHAKPGGHVALILDAQGTRVTAWAFEPTKEFRNVVRDVRAGDAVLIEGGIHDDPSSVSLEALTFLETPRRTRLEPPTCRTCGSQCKSTGRRGPYRCPSCGERAAGRPRSDPAPTVSDRHTVPISVRRHLSRPNGVAPVPLRWP
ncbi:MAG TPA: DUF1743 domain-containing protein [Candidatus Thermoplasmatota archaeon]|nr:DUF1743 domain-containing protein [Candidatus Thermoplasmatota archaeon]